MEITVQEFFAKLNQLGVNVDSLKNFYDTKNKMKINIENVGRERLMQSIYHHSHIDNREFKIFVDLKR